MNRWFDVLEEEDEYFWTSTEFQPGNIEGVNTHILKITPSENVYKMMIDKMEEGSFLPFINTEQDIWYSLFTNLAFFKAKAGSYLLRGAVSTARYCPPDMYSNFFTRSKQYLPFFIFP